MDRLNNTIKINHFFLKIGSLVVLWCVSTSSAWAGIYMGTDAMVPGQYIPIPLPDAITAAEYQRTPGRYPLDPSACKVRIPVVYGAVDKFDYL